MPQVRSANVINTPPCTRPRRLWCLSCATSAYSCSPPTTRCHSGPTRCTKPVLSTMVHPELFSFSVALSVMLLSPPSSRRTSGSLTTGADDNRRPFLPRQNEEARRGSGRAQVLGRDDGGRRSFHQSPACCS